ncbi:MAG: hypothetical protein KDN05_23255, partial [Verrucomicrobiae bacterium]|nr:hypothetical protein [Verrucomicrobiae bacterium]
MKPIAIPTNTSQWKTAPGSVRAKERFLILGRRWSRATVRLQEMLSPFGEAEVIVDEAGGGGVWHDDCHLDGFEGLMGLSSPFPRFTAWSRAMFHLSQTIRSGENVWFVEDDVAGNISYFADLIEFTVTCGAHFSSTEIRSRSEDPGWYYWDLVSHWFDAPWRSFSPLCRVNSLLILRALEFRKTHGRFAFHEGMFPSLAAAHGYRTLDWRLEPRSRLHFGEYRFRPMVESLHRGL